MANSKITITFLKLAQQGEFISFSFRNTYAELDGETIETFQNNPRNGPYQAQIPSPSTGGFTVGYTTAARYRQVFNLDYGGFNLYTVTQGDNIGVDDNVVTIEFNSDVFDFLGFHGGSLVEDDLATAVIENITRTDFQLNAGDKIVGADADFCNKFKATFSTTAPADTIYINDVLITNTNAANPYEVDLLRGAPYRFRLVNTQGTNPATINYPATNITPIYVPKLTVDMFDIDVVVSLDGGTVTINFEEPPQANPGLVLEYSLNDVDWQNQNIFSGQADGNYTVYIRDAVDNINFGCKVQIDFVVNEYGTRPPFAYISQACPINFVGLEDVDDCTVYPNDENSFSSKDLNSIKFCEPILFKQCDGLRTYQVKSNYENVTGLLRKDGIETPIPITQKSNNLNRFLSMDAIYYAYQVGKVGIYFESGNTYDENGLPDGTFELLGNLPDFAILGVIINIQGVGNFEIVDIVNDSNIGKKAIIINATLVPFGQFQNAIVYSIYDIINYEIYEYDLDYSLLEGTYDVLIHHQDDTNGEYFQLSENISVEKEQPETLAIVYFNKNNRDIFYKYGIKNFMRVGYENVYLNNDDEINIVSTDDSAFVTKSEVKDGNLFVFTELTRKRAFTLILALSCENVFINGLGYVKKASIKPNSIENTNLYSIEAEMIKTGYSYTNLGAGEIILTPGGETTFNIPPFIVGNDDFLTT